MPRQQLSAFSRTDVSTTLVRSIGFAMLPTLTAVFWMTSILSIGIGRSVPIALALTAQS